MASLPFAGRIINAFTGKINSPTLSTDYGDGYSQLAPFGYKNYQIINNLTIAPLTLTETKELKVFLDEGVDVSFTYAVPNRSPLPVAKTVPNSVKVSHVSKSKFRVSFSVVEV